jgi:hypothetical protein
MAEHGVICSMSRKKTNYRCLEAAGAIEDLAAATAYHFTEWLPRNIVVAL